MKATTANRAKLLALQERLVLATVTRTDATLSGSEAAILHGEMERLRAGLEIAVDRLTLAREYTNTVDDPADLAAIVRHGRR